MENLIQSANLFKDLNPFFKLINQHDDSPCLVILKWFFEWEFKVNLPWQSKKYFWLLFSTHELKKTPMNKKKLWKNNAQKTHLYEKETHRCFPNIGVFPPKWMVKIMVEHPIFKWMIWGVLTHYIRKPPHIEVCKGQGAFAHCGSLASVDLTEVKELKSEAFQRCGSLRHVSLPKVTKRDSGFSQQQKKVDGKKRIEMDGNGWTWKTWASFFLFCVLTIWKFQRLPKWAARYSCSSTWADVFFIDYQKFADTILFKYVIANCVIFNDSSNDLSFFPNGNTNPTRKNMWERHGGSM